MRRCLLTLAAIAAVFLAACGGTTIIRTAAPAIKQPAACAPGKSFMGCSASQTRALAFGAAPAGKYFPDVSSWQGHPNWDAAKPHIAAAAAKLGEYTEDPDVAYNVAAFKRLHIPFAVYWFVRPTGCQHEGALIEKYARELGVKLIVLDEEVSGISGYGACLNGYVHAVTGRNAVDYGSAGNDEDSEGRALDGWVAAYGPSTPPLWAGRKAVAWQFTDGRFGFPIYIPGIGQGDVSVDAGMFAATKPADPFPEAPNVVRYFGHRPHRDHARELNTLKTWKAHGCRAPVRRSVCKSTRRHEVLLQHRIYEIATAHGRRSKHPLWSRDHLGVRYHYFAEDLAKS